MTIERARTAADTEDEQWTPLRRTYPRITGPEAVLPATIDGSVVPLRLEDDMAEADIQYRLVRYLASVLNWQFQAGACYIFGNVPVYPLGNVDRYNWVAPDLAVFVGMNPPDEEIKSYRVSPPAYPAPSVVFEVASESTYDNDIGTKLLNYARMPTQEYYVYDPNTPRLWLDHPRLRGWWLDDGQMVEQRPDNQGRLWSAALDSYLLADGRYLRLTDVFGVRRPSEQEAALAERKQAEAERRRAEAERRRAEAERTNAEAERTNAEAQRLAKEKALAHAEAERLAKEKAWANAEAERANAESERLAKEKAWARLRELGYDPESLS